MKHYLVLLCYFTLPNLYRIASHNIIPFQGQQQLYKEREIETNIYLKYLQKIPYKI